MIRTFVAYLSILVATLPALFRTRREQAIVVLAGRQQLAAYAQNKPRHRLTRADRGVWTVQQLREIFPDAPSIRYQAQDNDSIVSE